jgi:hypothetical protein
LALAHSEKHIQNYFSPPLWPQTTPRPTIGLPSPPPSSTGSTTTTTLPESIQATPPSIIESEESQETFADSPIAEDFRQDFPPLQTATGINSQDEISSSPRKRAASGLDMDLMTGVPDSKDVAEVKLSVWPVTLTYAMECGELAIGNYLPIWTYL